MDFAAFMADDKTRSATIHQLLVLGEATKRLTSRFRAAHVHVAWDDMAGMRDRLIHGYNKVNFTIVWKTVQEDLPVLRTMLVPLLPSQEHS